MRLPLVSDALSGTKYFSTLDLKSGVWQIEMHPESQEEKSFRDRQRSLRI